MFSNEVPFEARGFTPNGVEINVTEKAFAESEISYEDAWMVMESPAFVKACKSACIHLMHRGQVQPHFSQAHCLPLVQAALAATPAKVPKRKK
jgi:hypothetical protein